MDITTVKRASVLALCLTACGTDNKPEDTDPGPDPTQVTLADGQIKGSVDGAALRFAGIPYAKPPVGDLRWKAPQKPDAWTGVRDATQFGKRCAQLANPAIMNQASNDEDCLYLNVWTPFPAPKDPVPVMIFIHGGFNIAGSASETVPFVHAGLFYSGAYLAGEHGVIVVSFNYRVGLFGFFAHPDLVAEGSSGNQGLLDQQFAFKWVKDNIAKFGGDPGNVTIFGESAGSTDVCMQMAAPSNAGLFHRAISESNGCTTVQRTRPQAEAAATTFATDVGCTGAGALACLRGKAADVLMATPDVAAGTGFGLDVDTVFIPDQPRALYDMGKIAKVPYLLGSNTDEGTLFLPANKPTTDAAYQATLTALFGATLGPMVAAQYPVSNFSTAPLPPTAALARVIGDSRVVCPTFDVATRTAHTGASVFMYNFDIPLSSLIAPGFGAAHGSELLSVFGTSPGFAADQSGKVNSELMQRYWTNFAKTGNPNAGADLNWPAFSETANVRINFALQQPTVVNNFRATECTFWRNVFNAQFP